jgi:hypothetical protein
MSKKYGVLSILSVLIILLSFNLVFAQLDIRQGSEDLVNFIAGWGEPIFDALLGGEDYTGELLFEKILLFFILLGLVFISLNNIPMFGENRKVLWVVTFIVPILMVRLINVEWLYTVLLSYAVLGIAILGIFPFIIYLLFLHNAIESTTARKIGWAFFMVVYLFLWSTTNVAAHASIYFWTMVAALTFLLFDGTIHYYLVTQKWARYDEATLAAQMGKINDQIDDINKSGLPTRAKERLIKKLERKKKQYMRLMH